MTADTVFPHPAAKSAGVQTKEERCSLSRKRNKHLQTILIEAAKLAPGRNEVLAQVHDRELAKGNANRATLAVARKLVEFLLAVERRGMPFDSNRLTA